MLINQPELKNSLGVCLKIEGPAYLFQLLGYPDLTVRAVVNLEPGGLLPAFPMALRDDSLSSPPVKMDLGVKV